MSEAPGWEAIDAALKRVYGAQEPRHWAAVPHASLGGPNPLDGISSYNADDHWHYVTYGFSELYGKETDDPSTSGFGFEMTFRLKRDGPQPPTWPLNLLQNAARYVFKSGNVFAPGHHLNLNGPISLDHTTDIVAALFAEDPELPAIDTPHGRLSFVQIVGATLDEYEAARRWNTLSMLDLLRDCSPKLVTDLVRTSVLADPRKAKVVAEGVERDGSTMDRAYVGHLEWKEGELTIGATGVPTLIDMLKGRLGHRHDFLLVAGDILVRFRPGERNRAGKDEHAGILELAPDVVESLHRTLQPKRGVYPAFSGFSIRVVPSEIKDSDGKVLRIVG